MKLKIVTCIIQVLAGSLLMLVSFSVFSDAWIYRQNTQISWREYNADAFSESVLKNKPMYIFVYSDECIWCKKFETETLEKPAVRALLKDNFIPIVIDQLEQPDLARKLGIKLVPGNVILTPDRKKLLRFYGFVKQTDLITVLEKTLVLWKKGVIPENDFGDDSTCCPVN